MATKGSLGTCTVLNENISFWDCWYSSAVCPGPWNLSCQKLQRFCRRIACSGGVGSTTSNNVVDGEDIYNLMSFMGQMWGSTQKKRFWRESGKNFTKTGNVYTWLTNCFMTTTIVGCWINNTKRAQKSAKCDATRISTAIYVTQIHKIGPHAHKTTHTRYLSTKIKMQQNKNANR